MVTTTNALMSLALKVLKMAATLISYLRLPVLASSGIAALASGLLYFKQK